ncbi:MAG: flagellar basal body-associated FliL family protein [Butyrivibrio sp.]|jgi:flagellar FliL protein|nr:flagellar basal body-associated FliL family protein [Butyrivibrio sp.]
MKRNMLSILILALLVVNLAMNAFMLLSVMTTNNKTAKIISDISAALELEAGGAQSDSSGFGKESGDISVSQSAYYELSGDDEMTIALKVGADGTQHYALVDLVLSMDTTNADYATYGTSESLTTLKGKMKSVVQNVVGGYTMDDAKNNEDAIKKEILKQLQSMYGSDFIYDVSFSKFLCQ